MHPAFSVIFFTVASGAGYGLFIMLTLALPTLNLDAHTALMIGIAALVLVTLGLISSVGHLANPKNAWRAFSRFRTSWLSREGVFAIVFYAPALIFLYGLYAAGDTPASLVFNVWWSLVSTVLFILALVTLFSTGMIYACLKTIRLWHTPLVPANYVAMALSSGVIVFLALSAWLGQTPSFGQINIALIIVSIALLLKWTYYFWAGRPQEATRSTINTATSFSRATVRLLDVGYTSGNFLTDEFGYQMSAHRIRSLRFVVLVLAFIVPIILLITLFANSSAPVTMTTATVAAVSAILGTFIERWLFFAEANHVVNLYHGRQSA